MLIEESQILQYVDQIVEVDVQRSLVTEYHLLLIRPYRIDAVKYEAEQRYDQQCEEIAYQAFLGGSCSFHSRSTPFISLVTLSSRIK